MRVLPFSRLRPKTRAGKVGMAAGGVIAGLIALDVIALAAISAFAASTAGR